MGLDKAKEASEFSFQGMAVGYFLGTGMPAKEGFYHYMPYRGPGHDAMQAALKAEGTARCYFDSKQGRHIFAVAANPESGRLKLEDFTLSRMPEKNRVTWLEPWVPAMAGMEKELEKEVGVGHVLSGSKCVPVARRIDRDEVLFQVAGLEDFYAVVHLTWSGKRETNSAFPRTEVFRSIGEWVEKKMKPDHDAFMGPV